MVRHDCHAHDNVYDCKLSLSIHAQSCSWLCETQVQEMIVLTHKQAEGSHVAIISAYTCLPLFIFSVALKWRHPRVLCRAVHLEPACVDDRLINLTRKTHRLRSW